MMLARIISIRLEPSVGDAVSSYKEHPLVFENVLIQVLPFDKPGLEDVKVIMASKKLSHYPHKDEHNRIIIPKDECKELERAVEFFANSISITQRVKRDIRSPSPHIGFITEIPEEEAWLSATSGMFIEERDVIVEAKSRIPFDVENLAKIADRLEGVTLLSEILASDHGTGRFREIVRFFEAAFSLSSTEMDKKLYQFLETNGLGYTRSEVKSWLDLRHSASHGDKKKSNYLVLESDVNRILSRMTQAAYDVLFNKKVWGSNSNERREAWSPSISVLQGKSINIKQGGDVFNFVILDIANKYPVDFHFEGQVLEYLKINIKGFWSEWHEEAHVTSQEGRQDVTLLRLPKIT